MLCLCCALRQWLPTTAQVPTSVPLEHSPRAPPNYTPASEASRGVYTGVPGIFKENDAEGMAILVKM